jgi:hypothetical protein
MIGSWRAASPRGGACSVSDILSVIGGVEAAPAGAEAALAAADATGAAPAGVEGCAVAANAHAATGAAIQRTGACARRRRIERVCCRRAARPIRPLNPESHPRRATRGARRRRTQAARADVNGAAKDDPRGADL